jgi:hypothetical protein
MSHHVAASSAKRESNNKTANSTNDGSELGGGGDYYKTVWNTGEESVTSVATQAGKTRLARERVASILRDTELRSSSDVEATFTSSSRGGRSSFGFGFDDVVERDDVEAASFAADDVNDDDELQLDPSRKPARNSFFKHLKQLQQARAKESSMFSDGLARDSDLGYLAGDGLVNLSDPVTSDAVGLGKINPHSFLIIRLFFGWSEYNFKIFRL